MVMIIAAVSNAVGNYWNRHQIPEKSSPRRSPHYLANSFDTVAPRKAGETLTNLAA